MTPQTDIQLDISDDKSSGRQISDVQMKNGADCAVHTPEIDSIGCAHHEHHNLGLPFASPTALYELYQLFPSEPNSRGLTNRSVL